MRIRLSIKGRFCRPPFITWGAAVAAGLVLAASHLSSAEKLNSDGEKLAVLKVGSEVYSNVLITMVTTTDIYFTHSRGMGNAKLEELAPELQSKFHFNAKKALEKENEQRQANARFKSWFRLQTNSPRRVELPPAISIEVADPTIEYKYYNLSLGKPENMQEGMIGDTYAPFNYAIDLDVRPVPNGGPVAFRFETVKFSVEMPVTIRLPLGALQKLKDHEEGHRHIDEYFYALSRKAAERAIQVTLTNKFRVSYARNLDSPEDAFVVLAKARVLSEYFKYTRVPSRTANAYYDELTDHGLNDVDSGEAAEKAIRRYAVQVPDEAAGVASADEVDKTASDSGQKSDQ